MFKCSECGIANKKDGVCLCGHVMKVIEEKKPYRIPKKSEKQKDVKAKDIAYYKQCFEYSNKRCEECNLPLGETWDPYFVAHIVTKNAGPEVRFDERNHVILCRDHHDQLDKGEKTKMKIYKMVEATRMQLHLEYAMKDKFED